LDLFAEALRKGGHGGDPEARQACDRALSIKGALLGDQHPDFAASLYQLGYLLYVNGDLSHAQSVLERSTVIRETALGVNDRRVAESLIPLAGLLSDRGDNARAESLFTRALAIREREFGSQSPEVGETLSSLATLRFRSGDFAEAASTYERALAILEHSLGAQHPKVATCLHNMGVIANELGDYQTSLVCYRRALAIRRSTLGSNHELVASTLANLGKDLTALGRLTDAGVQYREAIAIKEARFGPESAEVGRTLTNLGLLYLQKQANNKARTALTRAVSNLEMGGNGDRPELADALEGLATVDADDGHMQLAKDHYERALSIRERTLGPRHPDVGLLWTHYARSLVSSDPEAAIDMALRGEDISREHLRLTSHGLAERQALNYATTRPAGARVALLALTRIQNPPEATVSRVWDAFVKGRTLVLDEMALRRRASTAIGDTLSKALITHLSAARRRMANLLVAGPRGDPPERYRAQVERARDEMEKLEREWASRSSSFRGEQKRERIGLSDVRSSLPTKSVLIGFATAGDSAARAYVAFVLTSSAGPVAVPLGRAAAIDEKVSRWLSDLGEEGRQTRSGQLSRTSGAAVRQALWDPLRRYVGDAQRVFVVPEGAIHLVNFAALPDGRDKYLIEDNWIFHYLSAERDLVPDEDKAKSGTGLLALGNPAYGRTEHPAIEVRRQASRSRGGKTGCMDFDSLSFGPLPGTGREIKDIAKLWATKGDAVTLDGRDATEQAFKSKAPGQGVLHIATHGFFLGKCPSAAAGTRGIGATVPSSDGDRNRKPDPRHPLLLAGLALAGANQRATVGINQEDGILTAEEIAGLNLSGVEWAVLSACDTGNGQVLAGEGILGLERSFQIAGVRTVIMSLWAVDDEATRSWMDELYHGRIVRKLDTATAVAEASLHVLRERRAQARSSSPFYWAGFVAAGDWR
jgi:CHAT domain-containing protein/tetratricopeptide (TPR) repeat protein